ncbi:run domain Beclin-1-interacting and cysteine-rich domain-containing protein isoform X1 [Polypterus senegalus]|uniref:run domain Beclin-1-interacting and cysteine-rich domain-containing protein isoform X1 n=1 Tax=Polypterus senegalus TaxID=55291 RepID=UPI001963628B|nr:run domain Beclin-1-interacting and cysteine-rich domain-containing protein isoform X1 [Polypterus senegalus]
MIGHWDTVPGKTYVPQSGRRPLHRGELFMETYEEDEERRRERWKLLNSLKTTVEGLLSTNNPNVWSRYGGLERLCKDMNNILSHGLIQDQVYCRQADYWAFVNCARLEQFLDVNEGHKTPHRAYVWLHHSLQFHSLSAQLRPLLQQTGHTRKFYTDGAFLLSPPHVMAMFQCLEAVEQNNAKLLALIDTSLLTLKIQSPLFFPMPYIPVSSYSSFCDSSAKILPGAGGNKSAIPPPLLVPEKGSFTLPREIEDTRDDHSTELDDGPEYLAIGNLGCRRRSSVSSSTESTASLKEEETMPTTISNRTLSARRSSFSEGQRMERQAGFRRSHTRSHSDTGLAQGRLQQGGHRNITIIIEDPVAESYPEVCGAFSSHSSEVSTPSSLYLESEVSQYSSLTDGMFRRPSEGQSLISYLSEQDFGSCADLEKENAHFSISESLIAAIELMKCNLLKRNDPSLEGEGEDDEENDLEIQELKQKIRLRRQQIRSNRQQKITLDPSFTTPESGNSRHNSLDSLQLSDSGSVEEVEEIEIRDGNDGCNLIQMSNNGLSLSLASLFSDADITKSGRSVSLPGSSVISHLFLQSNSAESVAMGLLRQFEGMQLPAASELDWLVPEHDAPQKLLPIPDSLPISPDDGEHADIYRLRIRVRGNLEWAPPRPQIIFNIHPAPKRKVVVAKQNHRCAGCGIRIEPDYIKRLRYCEYLGKYFCQCCHDNNQSVVPSRILRKWDFSKYYVSNFSKDLLTKIWGDPLFNVEDINSALYRKVKALDQVKHLRVQLVRMKSLLKTCRLAEDLLDQFDQEPGHLTEDLHLYSLSDLVAVRKGELAPRLRDLVQRGAAHVHRCELCQAKGFICEFCGNDKDIVFPFELQKCRCCEECKACYHKSCFRYDQECPKCRRLALRREMLARQNMEVQTSEDEEEDSGQSSKGINGSQEQDIN